MTEFNAESTTDEVIAGVSLAGKVAVVTGGSAGLGVETARTLAGAGATVVMLARDPAKLETAMAGLLAEQPALKLESGQLDLADLDSVRACAADLLQRYPAIDLLINNAGVMACPLMRTAQGFELQFGTNHIGHFLLTCLLVPALQAAAPARVVNLSSAGHRFSPIRFEDPNFEHSEYHKWEAYGQSKTANALFSVALDKRLQGAGVRVFAVHPGAIATELGRHMTEEDMTFLQERAKGGGMTFKSVPQGAATSVWAATAAELADQGGLYLEDCQVAGPSAPDAVGGVESFAVDPDAAERLWQLSEELVGQRFEF